WLPPPGLHFGPARRRRRGERLFGPPSQDLIIEDHRMFERASGRGKGRPKPEKHLPYFKFVKGLAQAGCPVCNQTRASLDDWYENLLYESANDRPLRRRFDAERGFCARHAHRLCASNDGLGAAII